MTFWTILDFFHLIVILRLYDEKEKEGNIVEKQLQEHNLELEKLHQKGNALMTNVRIACERRQSEQRKREKTFEEGIGIKVRVCNIKNIELHTEYVIVA